MADRTFDGATALVTGAAGGLGQATAIAFARQGARVACADLTPDACEETVGLIGQLGGDALALGGDVAQPETSREWVARAEAVIWLSSPKSKFVYGKALPGGRRLLDQLSGIWRLARPAALA